MSRALTLCKCLYCGNQTGCYPNGTDTPEIRATVCGVCEHKSCRDEAREIAVGMRPWARPLTFWVGFFGQKPAGDGLALAAQRAWDADQDRIKWSNRKNYGRPALCDGPCSRPARLYPTEWVDRQGYLCAECRAQVATGQELTYA